MLKNKIVGEVLTRVNTSPNLLFNVIMSAEHNYPSLINLFLEHIEYMDMFH